MNDKVRKTLADAVANSTSSLSELSRGAKRNHAYLQQFIERGVPKRLPEDVRMYVAEALGLSEEELGAPSRPEPRRVSLREEWEEEMTSAAAAHRAFSRENYRPSIQGAVPEIDVELGAGEGTVGEVITLPLGRETYSGHRVVDEWLFPEEYLQKIIDTRSGNTLVLPVIGDSMQPTYNPGDRVLVDLTQNRLTNDTVYAISDGVAAPRLKRLEEVLFSNPRMVKILSDNPAHSTQEVELVELTIIGRVVGVVAKR